MHSFDALVVPNRQSLVGYAITLTRSKAAAEDLVQGAMVRALRAWDRFTVEDGGDQNLCARRWLFCILHNLFLTEYKTSRSRSTKLEGHVAEVVTGTYGVDGNKTYQPEIGDGIGDEVREALSQIDPDQADAMMLHASGMSYLEIANELRIPLGTVMSRLSRGRRALRSSLSGYAASEYRITTKTVDDSENRKEKIAVETGERPETDPGRVNRVVVGYHSEDLVGGEYALDSVSTRGVPRCRT